MRRALLRIVRIAVLVYVGLCIMLFLFQRSMIYYPQPREYQAGVTLLTLQSGGERVLVSTRPHNGDAALIYFGGNAEDVSQDMPDFRAEFPDTAIYLLHYRGYGGSSGKPTEKGIVADALVLFDLVHAQHSSVIVIGRSLGSGVAVQVASQRPVARLVLVTPYDGLKDIAAKEYPFIPVGLLLLDKYQSWRYAPQVTAPTLILAAGSDEVIPRSSTERLKARFKSGIVRYVVIPGAGHNTISDNSEYMALLKSG
jgi:hypothetical protein